MAGLFTQAAETFEKAVALDPQFADAYFALGHAYFDLKRWAEAADRLERAIELNPKDVKQDRLSFARTMLQPYGGGTKPVPKPISTEGTTAGCLTNLDCRQTATAAWREIGASR